MKKQKVTLKDIAKMTRFSVSTVSAVLNSRPDCYISEKNRQKILSVARRLGYRPNVLARGLVRASTNTIGIVASLFGNFAISATMHRLARHFYNTNYRLIFGEKQLHPNMDIDERKDVEREVVLEMMERRVDGIICVTSFTPKELESVVGDEVPVIIFYHPGYGFDYPYPVITTDRFTGIRKLVHHLYEHGCRRFGYYVSEEYSNQAKCEGFKQGLIDVGLDPGENPLICEPNDDEGAARVARNAKELRLDALMCNSDDIAMMVLYQLSKLGIRTPDDIAVTGFDGQALCKYGLVPLTTAVQRVDIIAEKTSEKMLKMIREGIKKDSDKVLIQPELVFRRSCGC